MSIARDIGTPFDPNDPLQFQEFDEFMCPPDTEVLAADLQNPLAVNSRAHRLLDANSGIVGRIAFVDEDGDGILSVVFPTPDPVTPQVTFVRQGMDRNQAFPIPGLGSTEMWSFRNGDGGFVWPGPTIRVREGMIAHTVMNNARGQHTIHQHGIEPTAMNDGVGHLTFDVQGQYTYQWLPREAGTYFYHCHVNTTLHFEMGMYGMLIVDPDVGRGAFCRRRPGRHLRREPRRLPTRRRASG
jgi:plastocyanin